MYKTVRKGDASLQYTILPQTDQFSSSGFPQTSGKAGWRVLKYSICTLMILFVVSYVAVTLFMNQSDERLFASTVLAIGRVGHNSSRARNSSRSQEKDMANKSKNRLPVTTTVSSTEAYRKQDIEDEMTTLLEASNVDEQESQEFTTTDSTTSSTQRSKTSTESTTSVKQTSTSTTTYILPTTWSTGLKTLTSTPSEATKMTSSAPTRKAKMPRVTLKLRENETIPQMYMKAGIASYKKGNITTSVLAHGLSLEGLIFKTPEGTINPWTQKWFFTDPSSDFQWKVQLSRQSFNRMAVKVYITLAVFLTFASILVSLLLYVRKTTRRLRQSVEEPEVEGQEEDKSTLLGVESQEIEEKE
ncbi:cell wall integrity and stress response component 3-like isoform X2 [Bombus impatiens]|uniref:Cell wall integrity and stress response component 3-like isoform X2 n=1 Tax=Bombus impatiens TaxID=132113 RepID=A0A6P3E1E4_BOMIM|nr:cell wall integrity and stress response component 3-like isoform X2 [Bombus impatiens]XP_050488047.1 uncharacterized protein LOC126872302 isoform X1 [Bombus huntii]